MPIEKLSAPVAEYIANFRLCAVAQRDDGRLRVTKNPVGYQNAWWCLAKETKRLAQAAREMGGDVVAAAARDRIGVTEHTRVLERVTASLQRIDDALEKAKQDGTMKFFNAEYRRRRDLAVAQRRPFVGYKAAKTRLEKAIARRAINPQLRTTLPTSLISEVFCDAPRRPAADSSAGQQQ